MYETIRQVRRRLPVATPLIGFAGAPWTLAAYMVEGGSAPEFYTARAFALSQPEAFAGLIERLSGAVFEHLSAQIDAGVDVVQLFDSWAGVLPEPEFARWCEIPARQIIARLKASLSGRAGHCVSARRRHPVSAVLRGGPSRWRQPR